MKRRARSETDEQGRASAVATLRLALNTLLRLFAPFVPTITDEIWSWTYAQETGYESVHQAHWPTSPPSLQRKGARDGARNADERGMPTRYQLTGVAKPTNPISFQTACQAIAAVRKAKHEAKIGLGKPLGRLVMTAPEELLTQLRLVESDVADAAGAPYIIYDPNPSADGSIATVEAPG